VLKLAYAIEEVDGKDYRSQLGQGIIDRDPVDGVGHHEHAYVAGLQAGSAESSRQAVHPVT
jgi:hypothetical protein